MAKGLVAERVDFLLEPGDGLIADVDLRERAALAQRHAVSDFNRGGIEVHIGPIALDDRFSLGVFHEVFQLGIE